MFSYCNWWTCSIFIFRGKDILWAWAAGSDHPTNYSAGELCMVCIYTVCAVVWFVSCRHLFYLGIKLLQVSGSNYITLGLKHKESVNSIRLNTFIWLQFQDFLKDLSMLSHWIHVHMTAVSILSEGSSQVWCQVPGMCTLKSSSMVPSSLISSLKNHIRWISNAVYCSYNLGYHLSLAQLGIQSTEASEF